MLKNRGGIISLLVLVLLFFLILIAALTIALKGVNKRLNNISLSVEEMAEQHITADVELNQSIAINSYFRISDAVSVGIDMVVETVIPVDVEIPIDQNLLVPFKIGVKDYIKLDTTIMITDDIYAIVEDTLKLDQNVTMPTSKKRGITLPVKASIPLNERVKVIFNQAIPVHAVVPVDLLIIDTLPVGLNLKVPVTLMLPVRIPVKTNAKVSFPESIPVTGEIPVSLSIPVDIPLSETSLEPYFTRIAKGLKELTKLNAKKSDENNPELKTK